MSELLGWIKNIFSFTIVLTAVFQLIPNPVYAKYIKVFGGIVMTILVLQPVLQFFGQEDLLEKQLVLDSWQLQLDEMQLEIEEMSKQADSYYMEEIEKAVQSDGSSQDSEMP
jgi:stage III sporulation protein AF